MSFFWPVCRLINEAIKNVLLIQLRPSLHWVFIFPSSTFSIKIFHSSIRMNVKCYKDEKIPRVRLSKFNEMRPSKKPLEVVRSNQYWPAIKLMQVAKNNFRQPWFIGFYQGNIDGHFHQNRYPLKQNSHQFWYANTNLHLARQFFKNVLVLKVDW